MIAVAPGLGLQRAEVGAGVGFGEHGGGQDFAAGDLWQPFGLLRVGAAHRDQLARDLRPGAERSRADPAARQFLGDEAHDELAEAEAAKFLCYANAEGAEVVTRGWIGEG